MSILMLILDPRKNHSGMTITGLFVMLAPAKITLASHTSWLMNQNRARMLREGRRRDDGLEKSGGSIQ